MVLFAACQSPPPTDDLLSEWQVEAFLFLREPPIDLLLKSDTVWILERTGSLQKWILEGGGLHLDSSYELLEMGIQSPTSLVKVRGRIGVWEAHAGTVHFPGARCPFQSSLIVEPDPSVWAGTGYLDFSPRGHRHLGVLDNSFVVETRAYGPQSESLVTTASLILATPPKRKSDTLVTLAAASYSRKKGSLIVCCGRAPLFSQHLQWATDGHSLVAVVNHENASVSLLNPFSGENAQYSLPLSTQEISKEEMRAYSKRLADWLDPERNWVQRLRYSLLLRQNPGRVRTEYAEVGPVVSDLRFGPRGRIWAREFDPDIWPFGLSGSFLTVDPVTGRLGRRSFPAGVILADIQENRFLGLSLEVGGGARALLLKPNNRANP
jgi:hypothetical protein